jgi:hypothetical protein
MKKAPARKAKRRKCGEMRAEYRFDYSKAKPNRFASRVDKSRIVVALDPDVSEVFTTPDAVNRVLRALMAAMPAAKRR